jgi:flagellar basal-body rod protein FlgG
MKALTIAATGMNAQQLNLEVIANNIANINTTGYKRAKAEFSDLLYQTERTAGVPNSANQSVVPEGAMVGLGVQTAAVRNLHIQGALTQTGNPFDVALEGRGWFQIQNAAGDTLYSRAGAFNTNGTGQLVTLDGNMVEPNIVVPTDALEVDISETGQVSAKMANQTQPLNLGQLQIANFANEAGLEPLGNNLFKQTEASGDAVVGVPGDPGFATLKQNYLESSNVDPVKEITDLITAQRAYEMNSKVIQAADEMASVVSKNLGG